MEKYYINRNAQQAGPHIVHKKGCCKMPEPQNLIYLGQFRKANEAIKAAQRYFDNVELCCYCCHRQ